MISIGFEKGRFNYRVAGVLLRGNKVLLHKEEKDLYWYLPGGRCELMEPSPDTLAREFMEEANATVTVKRLLWVIENFFHAHGEDVHELGFYYLVESDDIDTRDAFTGVEANGNILYFNWFDVNELENIRVLPAVMKDHLKNIGEEIRHFINKEV